MKVFAISDLHLTSTTNKPMNIFGGTWENYWEEIRKDWQEKVSEGDIVVIAGDISWAMKLEDALKDLEDIDTLPGKKIIIRGNHDYWWNSVSAIRKATSDNFTVIQNDAFKIGKYVFCGTRGWSVPENDFKTLDDEKIYKRELLRLEMSLDVSKRLKEEGDEIICIMHYPPFNSRFENNDFTDLLEKYEIKTLIYGHLHGNDCVRKLRVEKNGVTYFLTSCDIINNTLKRIK